MCVYVCVIVSNPRLNGALMRLYQAALLLSSLEGCGFVLCESLTLLYTHKLARDDRPIIMVALQRRGIFHKISPFPVN